MIGLRPYQQRAIDMLADSFRNRHKAPVLVAPTGSGKTRLAAAICERAVNKGNHVLFLAPRRGLVFQTSDSFRELGIDTVMIMAGEDYDPRHMVDVASIDTLVARIGKDYITNALQSVKKSTIIIVDEAHTSVSKARADILNAVKAGEYGHGKLLIGLTASPCVAGGGGLGGVYDDLLVPVSMHELIDGGYLAKPRYFAAPKPDLSGVKVTAGEYKQDDLGDVFADSVLMGDVLTNWEKIARNTTTVIFTPTRANAAELVDRFNRAGYASEYVDANTKDPVREQIYHRLQTGQTKCLMNVGIVSMGVDIPAIQTVVMATATKSIAKWMQAIGRALRPSDGKECAYIIDHGGMTIDQNMGPVEDIVDWSLDEKEKIQDRVLKRKKERKEPKEITCSACSTVFKSRRDCPSCGLAMKQPGEPLEFYEAELEEVVALGKKANRIDPPEVKIAFFGGLKAYANARGYSPGWAAHKYRRKYGVWPNKYKDAQPVEPNDAVLVFIKREHIAYAKRRQSA